MINNRYNNHKNYAQKGNSLYPRLVVIVGPTASGKTALAIELAERFGGEVLCADSRTVYRGMDIGTAKPSAADRARVPHHGLDLVDPDISFSAADYKVYAMEKLAEIPSRGKLPIMVGGSGMYIDAVLYDYDFRAPANPTLRADLSRLSVEELQAKIVELRLELPADPLNPRRLMRVIESGGTAETGNRENGMRENTLVLGLDADMPELEQRISRRVNEMVAAGLTDEVRKLAEKYGWDVQAMQAPGYRELRDYLMGVQDLDETRQLIIKDTRALAKRQKTWFKRNKSIQWLTTEDKMASAVDITTTFMNT